MVSDDPLIVRAAHYDKVMLPCRVLYEWNEYSSLQSDITRLFRDLYTGV